MRTFRSWLIGAGLAFALGGAASAGVVIDFQSLERNDSGTHNWGYVYEEDGFRLSHPESEPFQFATFGTQESRYPGSTALFNNTVNGVITLAASDGSAFSIFQIDISNLNNNGPVTVNFTGHLRGGGQVNASFRTSGSQNRLETFFFNDTWRNLDRVVWTQQSPFHQFDNIHVVIPGPGVLALMGLGLVSVRRRRR